MPEFLRLPPRPPRPSDSTLPRFLAWIALISLGAALLLVADRVPGMVALMAIGLGSACIGNPQQSDWALKPWAAIVVVCLGTVMVVAISLSFLADPGSALTSGVRALPFGAKAATVLIWGVVLMVEVRRFRARHSSPAA